MKIRILVFGLVSLVLAFVGFTYFVSQPVFDEQRGEFEPGIADRSEALTFARSASALILVTRHDPNGVTGIDLTMAYGVPAAQDLLDWLAVIDREALKSLEGPLVSVSLDELIQPVNYTYPHIAAGTNFKEHADEVYLDDPPFLFPKLSPAGRWNDDVAFTPRLDFEAELCAFPLRDIDASDLESGRDQGMPEFGLVLCNDFTDRWTLVQELDLGQPMGLTGFAAGKGCSSCFPTGYLVVIPDSPRFYLTLDLSLYVNDALRQRFHMKDVILGVEDIVRQSFDVADEPFTRGDKAVALMPQGKIPKGTLILTGTAAGVLFKPANIWHQGFYLQSGDVVRTEGTFLGQLVNKVTPASGG